MKSKFLLYVCIVSFLSVTGCNIFQNEDNDNKDKKLLVLKEALASCQENTSFQTNFRRLASDLSISRKRDSVTQDKIVFNLDLTHKKPQIVHLSSDPEKLPFMLVCTIDGTPEGTEHFKITKLHLAVRSIFEDPATYFTISSISKLVPAPENKGYDYFLHADIDLNTPTNAPNASRSVSLNIDNQTVKKGEHIDIKLSANALKRTLDGLSDKINSSYIDKDFITKLDKRCCNGVICSVKLMM